MEFDATCAWLLLSPLVDSLIAAGVAQGVYLASQLLSVSTALIPALFQMVLERVEQAGLAFPVPPLGQRVQVYAAAYERKADPELPCDGTFAQPLCV